MRKIANAPFSSLFASAVLIFLLPNQTRASTVDSQALCVNLSPQQCTRYKSELSSYVVAYQLWTRALQTIDDNYYASLRRAQHEKLTALKIADSLSPNTRSRHRTAARRKYVMDIDMARDERGQALRRLGSAPRRPTRPQT